ncbi:hypothetical protein ABGY98_001506 [Salmonella enterica]|uniref:Uncharacterized protein n=1 Tax=Salmonella enterica subsp. diarizonae serovar 48:i:z TaxID=1192842 RepID=A0A7U6BCF3_SALDZ|nr:hypothetical protein [Salmonella enterica]EAA4451706.1 hypothetical protein [Salmonella enterica subsp. diarizonae]EDW6119171.1 hypothetical protein [Salmonella enterica subsp. salamae]AXC71207.1 hypothetical protein DOE59_06105 [Salmonella enterica subsp. diarizonae serovar 48:i:z]EAM2671205.1 hypothetical protein [Salmonella enterica]EAM6403591.1 hypothetical protein [Salmonella enterica]
MPLHTDDDVNTLKRKLADIDKSQLTEAITELAVSWPAVCDVAEWLVSTPSENMARFTSRLTQMKERDYKYPRRSRTDENILIELRALLREVCSGATSAKEEMEGLLLICQTDEFTFEQDLSEKWDIEYFYTDELAPHLISCATRIDDIQWLISKLQEILTKDSYGIREPVLLLLLQEIQKRTG